MSGCSQHGRRSCSCSSLEPPLVFSMLCVLCLLEIYYLLVRGTFRLLGCLQLLIIICDSLVLVSRDGLTSGTELQLEVGLAFGQDVSKGKYGLGKFNKAPENIIPSQDNVEWQLVMNKED